MAEWTPRRRRRHHGGEEEEEEECVGIFSYLTLQDPL